MKKNIKQIFTLSFLITVLVIPYFVFAQSPLDRLKSVGETGAGYQPYTSGSLYDTIGMIVQAFLGLLGVIFIVLMLYAGYNWMTARGDEPKIEKAKDTIRRAIIGVIVVAGSYAIWSFIANALLK